MTSTVPAPGQEEIGGHGVTHSIASPARRTPLLPYAIIALSLAGSVAIALQYSLWAGVVAFPAGIVLSFVLLFAMAALTHAYRWQRNAVDRTCSACATPVRYREVPTCPNCGAVTHPRHIC